MQFPAVFPEPLAVEWGQDEHGIFQSFAAGPPEKRIVQRMRWIRPGKFLMGSPETEVGRSADEVQHAVELTRGYWLADTPVTQALWQAVMGTNPSIFVDPNEPTRPVEQVSWNDCQEFLLRLNELVPGLDARLPTEAEWEYACRAGTEVATWVGDLEQAQEIEAPQLDAIAWYHVNAEKTTHPVAQKQVNPWGLYDMLGNVYEWCMDWYGDYEPTFLQDPGGSAVGADRVMRGGSWYSSARLVRAASRLASLPGYRDDDVGFRLARGPAPSPGSGARAM